MQVKLLQTTGTGEFIEVYWTKPDITADEIEVQAVMTGVCRSDIDMMQGNFGPLPINMQGHEGLAQVTKVGKNVKDVKAGDYVATRGEPAYADRYLSMPMGELFAKHQPAQQGCSATVRRRSPSVC